MQAARVLRDVRRWPAAVLLLAAVTTVTGWPGVVHAQKPHLIEEAFSIADGYRLDVVAAGLTFPTDVTFDDANGIYVLEAGYSFGPAAARARIVRVRANGSLEEVAAGFRGPLTGLTWKDGYFYIADGGRPGRILKVDIDGNREVLVDNLPTFGDHFTGDVVFGKDGKLYFSVGTMTNAGVVGPDNFFGGWLGRSPRAHDISCRDIELRGRNFTTDNPLTDEPRDKATTGAFVPFGTRTQVGLTIEGHVPCNGAIFRIGMQGGEPELVADGFRNPFGLGFGPDGKLYVTNNGFDEKGSRPVANDWDTLWQVKEGGWYGWPDYASGLPVSRDRFVPKAGPRPMLLLAQQPRLAGQPLIRFAPHSGVQKFDFSTSEQFGFPGQMFLAQFGDLAPVTGDRLDEPPGFRVVRVDLSIRKVENFLVNRQSGAVRHPNDGISPERPVAAAFDPGGRALYVVDFGLVEVVRGAITPVAGTGVLWRISRAPTGPVRSEPVVPKPPPTRWPNAVAVIVGAVTVAAAGLALRAIKLRRI